jgi:urate oxidase
MTVDVQLDGDFEAAYTAANNRLVVPTDTMKNTVYALAKQTDFPTIESFGRTLGAHFVDAFEHVSKVTVRLVGQPWKRIVVEGSEHPHAFIGGGNECETAIVIQDRASQTITSGLEGLVILKTTGSGFSDFLRDPYTTLPETEDRIFATTVNAHWRYGEDRVGSLDDVDT